MHGQKNNKLSNIMKIPFSGSRVVQYGRTDMTKLTVTFTNFANAHNNIC